MDTKLVIFDMDGVLVDSEPYWNHAIRKGFDLVGLHMTDEMCEETMGARLNEVVDFRVEKHGIDPAKARMIEQAIEDEIVHLVKTRSTLLPGVKECIALLAKEGIPMSIASSSPHRLINCVLEMLDEGDHFSKVFSAQDDALGKPNPAVYIRCAHEMNVAPEHCFVIEDSVNGMVAAKAAKMKVMVVPDPKMFTLKEWGLADYKLASLKDFKISNLP